jgi:Domain of unknown function (DUF1906)
MHFNRYARKGRGRRALGPACWALGLLLATAGGPAASATASVTHAPSQLRSQSRSASQRVTYRGYTFTIPRTWRVTRLAAHPRSCVRFDRHVLYLGAPGRSQHCPSSLVGTTEALLVQPATGRPTAAMYPVDRLITVTTSRIMVTATYSADRALVDRILASASLQVPVRGTRTGTPPPGGLGNTPARMAAPRATLPAGATDFTGKGFDACAAPSAAAMQTWLRKSPYRAVGIYIGGSDRACAQPNLTSSWVSQQQASGWHFMPIYVGPQASFGEINSAASQAVSAAKDAVSQARLLGFGPGTPLYYDMEAYSATLNGRVLRFLTSWTRELHTLGYSSGVYSNSLSGIQALVNNYANPADAMPDVIYDALWNGAANTSDPILPSTEWAGHQRIHQYLGGQNVTYGGDTINIDRDYLDVQQGVTGGSPQASQAASQSAGDVDAFFKGTDGKLWHDWYTPGSGWHGPVKMGGSLATQPSAVAAVPGNVAVFAKGKNGRLQEASFAPATNWSGLRQLNMGILGSRPVAVGQANGQIDVFWRGSSDHHLWHAEYRPASGWSRSQSLGGRLSSAPAPAVSGHGALTVAWKGINGHLWEVRRSGPSWGKPVDRGMGKLGSAPAVTGLPSGAVDVFWAASSHKGVWHITFTPGSGWSKATELTGGLSAGPVAVSAPGKSADVFWKGTDGKLWWSASSGSRWQKAVPLGMGTLGAAPFAAGQPSGVIDVFWKGAGNHLWQARYSEGSWAGPSSLGGAVS